MDAHDKQKQRALEIRRVTQKTIKITSMIKIERTAYNFIFEDV